MGLISCSDTRKRSRAPLCVFLVFLLCPRHSLMLRIHLWEILSIPRFPIQPEKFHGASEHGAALARGPQSPGCEFVNDHIYYEAMRKANGLSELQEPGMRAVNDHFLRGRQRVCQAMRSTTSPPEVKRASRFSAGQG